MAQLVTAYQSVTSPCCQQTNMGNPSTVMKHGGYYNRHSECQRAFNERCLGLLQQAAATAPLPTAPGSAFRIADLGCSQGANSVAPVSAVLEVLQSRVAAPAGAGEAGGAAARLPLGVQVFHVDLPGNDWGSLFGVVEGEQSYLPGPGECSGLQVFAAAVGRSFYKRLFPPSCMHLVMAFSSLHWLGEMPAGGRPQDTLYPFATSDAQVYESFRTAANAGLRRFFELRAAEVAPGGSLVCHFLTHTPGRDEPFDPNASAHSTAVLEMVSEGLLDPEDLPYLTIPIFFFQPDDVRGLLCSGPLSHEWSLRCEEQARMQHPAHAAYQAGRLSRGQAVRQMADSMRAVHEQHFLNALSRSHSQRRMQQQQQGHQRTGRQGGYEGRRQGGGKMDVGALVAEVFERAERIMNERFEPRDFKLMLLWLQRK